MANIVPLNFDNQKLAKGFKCAFNSATGISNWAGILLLTVRLERVRKNPLSIFGEAKWIQALSLPYWHLLER